MDSKAQIPDGWHLVLPHELKIYGDRFWGGSEWKYCTMFGDIAGVHHSVIRADDGEDFIMNKPKDSVSTKDKVKKYLAMQK